MIKNNIYLWPNLCRVGLNKNYLALFFFALLTVLGRSQQNEKQQKDSVQVNKLDEVVVTGESQVMSLSKKLFKVDIIDKKNIARLAGNNLSDVLTQNLNITVVPDASTGRSTISMFGFNGEYVKVLIDGIPVVTDNGFGNNVDINQINLEDVERIEIVEGNSGVLYGDNAAAGVVNIVTKRSTEEDYKVRIQGSLQEETIGEEYALFDRGRHVQNLKVGHQVSSNFSYDIGVSRNDYAGFYNIYQGKDYVNIQNGLVVNDTLRGTEWNPKEQLTLYGNFSLRLGKHNLFYKLQHYDETVYIYNRIINGAFRNGTLNPTALDRTYLTDRLVNNLNISGPVKGPTNYNVSLSYQNQKRDFQEYTYNIFLRGIESYNIDRLDQSSDFFFSKGTVSNIVPKSDVFNLLLGYEFVHQKGFDAIASGAQSTNVVENTLENYDVFTSVDLNFGENLSFYPGLRLVNSSIFDSKLIWSLPVNYRFSDSSNLKLTLGSAYKNPNFNQLFLYFVDANHNVQGNRNLAPEDGISIFMNYEKTFLLGAEGLWKTTFSSNYYDIKDRIQSINTEDEDGRPLFTYANIGREKKLGFRLTNKFVLKNWQAGIGASVNNRSIEINENVASGDMWNFNLTSNLAYSFPKINTSLTAQLNYRGRALNTIEGANSIEVGETSSFTWLDASIRTGVFKNIDVTLGARNIINIVTVDATDIPSGAHGASEGSARLFGNGRSYFLKLLYTLNFN